MVLYFTGTGNSRYAAKVLAKELEDECFSMNDAIRSGNREELFSERPWVIVTPTYAWRIPAVVEEWLSSVRLTGSDKAWFVMTCGDGTGNAAATEACTGCGKCAALCPMRNIEIQNDRPVWGNACTHCMACISACPENAVEYRHTSVGKPRYYLDENGNLK